MTTVTKNKGFITTELLVVILGIIAFLSLVLVPSIQNLQRYGIELEQSSRPQFKQLAIAIINYESALLETTLKIDATLRQGVVNCDIDPEAIRGLRVELADDTKDLTDLVRDMKRLRPKLDDRQDAFLVKEGIVLLKSQLKDIHHVDRLLRGVAWGVDR